jgi:predicted nucleic acid-binding protein
LTLVDTNVLVDLSTGDPVWADWSQASLEAAALRGPLFINEVIYAELSVRFDRLDELDAFLEIAGVGLISPPKEALFLAGKAFGRYRQAGGLKSGVLSDFFIGAHAQVLHLDLLTRDVGKYRTYFPTVTLIAPTRD